MWLLVFIVLFSVCLSPRSLLVAETGVVPLNPKVESSVSNVFASSAANLCRPLAGANKSKRDLELDNFLLEQWAFALKTLNLGASALNDMKSSLGNHVHDFNHFQSGCNIYMYGRNSTPVTYCKIWKNANEAIRGNLWSLVMQPCQQKRCPALHKTNAFYPRGFIEVSNFGDIDTIVKHYSHNKISSTSHFKTFTFLRDPLEHFMSGLTESVHRTAFSGVPKSRLLRNITSEIISMYIKKILEAKPAEYYPALREKQHFYPMAGVFLEWPIHYVGSLYKFDFHWNNIQQIYGIQEPFNRSMGMKKTTMRDPNNVKRVFTQMTTEDPRYMRVVCHMLMLDYVCFPSYKLPEACSDMETYRKKGQEIFLNYSSAS